MKSPLIAVAAILLAATCMAAEWKEFESEDNFHVKLPDKPQATTQTKKTALGKVKIHLFVVSGDGGKVVYLISYTDFPKASGSTSDMLDGARDGAVKAVNGKLVPPEKKIALGKHPGREFKFAHTAGKKNATCRTQIFMVEKRLYQQMVIYLDEAAPDESDVTTFFSSFKLANEN